MSSVKPAIAEPVPITSTDDEFSDSMADLFQVLVAVFLLHLSPGMAAAHQAAVEVEAEETEALVSVFLSADGVLSTDGIERTTWSSLATDEHASAVLLVAEPGVTAASLVEQGNAAASRGLVVRLSASQADN